MKMACFCAVGSVAITCGPEGRRRRLEHGLRVRSPDGGPWSVVWACLRKLQVFGNQFQSIKTKDHLKEKLEEYMARFSKVRIVRTKKREGLIRTRLLGASMARGEVLTFLDSHCEVNVNWLPPLLNQIALNHRTIVCPMIDVIDHNHFGYEAQAGDAMRGAFDWEMYYKRIPIPPELQRADPSDPFE
ncbi:Polypeptide N-acetylgalactosaminyltransferase-like 6 [Galemys pyrenaicus]|uniref:Polypeptide N-acetylgalactosaminyltransferase-like 6 n=1 Tax=Galemys pyrenaicus TaxID=202257 RepID=A0A8J6DD90_GALPY|nr:Polypeptide N-acetylgalactosaminyltransferase-like 6 [Galemys pyrenaicus]